MKRNLKNSAVHILFGILFTGIVGMILILFSLAGWHCFLLEEMRMYSHVVVMVSSLGIEVYQYFVNDARELKWEDRIFDMFEYQIGAIFFNSYLWFLALAFNGIPC